MRKLIVFLIFSILLIGCNFQGDRNHRSDRTKVEVEKVRLDYPDTYWPAPSLWIEVKNTSDSRIDSLKFHGVYKSPNVDTVWWERGVQCKYSGGLLPNETSTLKECYFIGGKPSDERRENASLYLY